MTRRLFIALVLDEHLATRVHGSARAALGNEAGSCGRGGAVRLVCPQGMHLTLLFLGATPDERAAELRAALSDALRGLPAPPLRISSTGAFPDHGRARVLFASVEELRPGLLAEIRLRVLSAAESAGFDVGAERRRPFRAHVTVARIRRAPERARAPLPGAFFDLCFEDDWTPRAVTLVEALRGGGGPAEYAPLASFPMGAA